MLLYRALAAGPMSVVAPTTALAASVVPILAGVRARRAPRPGRLRRDRRLARRRRAHHPRAGERAPRAAPAGRSSLLALGGGAIFGLFFVFLHQTGSEAGLWPLLAARFTSVPLLALLVTRQEGVRSLELPRLNSPVIVSGTLDMGANICYLLALRHGMLAVVAALTGLYPASTILLAQSHLRERLHLPQVIGLGVAACAAVLIAV